MKKLIIGAMMFAVVSQLTAAGKLDLKEITKGSFLSALRLIQGGTAPSETGEIHRDAWNRSWSRDGCFLLSADTG